MTTKKPVHVIRKQGVKASIWKNDGKNGGFYSVTFERYYRDGDAWKTSHSYRASDLPALVAAFAEVKLWLFIQERTAAT